MPLKITSQGRNIRLRFHQLLRLLGFHSFHPHPLPLLNSFKCDLIESYQKTHPNIPSMWVSSHFLFINKISSRSKQFLTGSGTFSLSLGLRSHSRLNRFLITVTFVKWSHSNLATGHLWSLTASQTVLGPCKIWPFCHPKFPHQAPLSISPNLCELIMSTLMERDLIIKNKVKSLT